MPTHPILSTGPFLADPEPIDEQTGGGPKVGRDEPIQPEEDVVRIGEENPGGPQTGGTVKTGRTKPIQPETED